MSTYNGEHFVQEQIESVLKQVGVNVNIYIRDDGSTDGTINKIKELAVKHSNITISAEENVGCYKSFFKLIYSTKSGSAEYFALCDQDDVWEPNKLYEAILMLKEFHRYPTLYCSNLKVVNSNLLFIRLMNPKLKYPSKNTCFLDNVVTGCTVVFNASFLELILRLPSPSYVVMHDWWLYCVASFYGKIIYDERAFIRYRQHTQNVYGARTINYLERFFNLCHSLKQKESEHYREAQAKEFLKLNAQSLSGEEIDSIRKIVDYRKNWIYKVEMAFNMKMHLSFRIRVRILLGLI